MSESDLVTIATFGTSEEASIVKIALEAEDVPAYLMGSEANNMMWYIGTALGGVKLQVARCDVNRATEVVRASQSANAMQPARPWICPNCGVEVDAGFALCWSCSTATDQDSASAESVEGAYVENDSLRGRSTDDPGEPFNVSLTTPDETAARAWRAAVLGIFSFPLSIYSLFLILKVFREKLSPMATRKICGSLAINVIILAESWSLLGP